MVLSGLGAGAYKISVGSQDAAGNLTVDDNGGSYYQVAVPMAAPSMMSAPRMRDVSREIAEINSAVDANEIDRAMNRMTLLITTVAEQELRSLVASNGMVGDDLQALDTLAQRLGGALESYANTSEYIDFVAVNQPLGSFTCINLPTDTVAEACGCPAIADAVVKVYPGLILEPHPSLRPNEYRLKHC